MAPLYEFECPDCGNRHAEIRPVSDYKLPARCAKCGGAMPRVVSQLGAIAMVTKGGNWIHSMTTGATMKGNRRPKTVRLGGRRKNPTQKQVTGVEKAVA